MIPPPERAGSLSLPALVLLLLLLPPAFSSGAPARMETLIPPVAVISYPTDGSEYELPASVHFNGCQSHDPDGSILSWLWSFGDGATSSRANTTNHEYLEAGNYTVGLTVVDDDGLNGTASILVFVKKAVKLQRPVPVITSPANDSAFAPGERVEFDGRHSWDPDGSIALWRWDFGDGSPPGNGSRTSHSYSEMGTCEVVLNVTDDSGLGSETSIVLTIADVSRPVPEISTPQNDSWFVPNQTIEFYGKESRDKDGEIVSWLWDLGDGSAPVNASVVEHAYSREGNYTATLTVTDDDGLGASASVTVHVRKNSAPVANISSPLNGSSATVGEPVEFRSGGSHDPDGDPLFYYWWTDDQGVYDTADATHRFEHPGMRKVGLSVRDQFWEKDIAEVYVNVARNITPPVAVISFPDNRSSFNPNISIRFDGSNSTGKEDLFWAWDFGDGTVYDAPVREHAYSREGDYWVTLTVSTGDMDSQARIFIRVSWTDAPHACIRHPPDRAAFPPNQTINFSSHGSSDPANLPLSYLWDFGDGGTSGLADPSHAYSKEGTYTVSLLVNNSRSSTRMRATVVLYISSGNLPPVAVISGPLERAYYHPNDTIGFSANRSYDPDGEIVEYSWYWGWGERRRLINHDIEFEWSSPEEVLDTIMLVVRDDGGLEHSTYYHVHVYNYGLPSPIIRSPLNDTDLPVGAVMDFEGGCDLYDAEHPFLNYSWDFGDGKGAQGQNATHSYSKAGRYRFTLSIFDGEKTGTRTGFVDVVARLPGPDVVVRPGAGNGTAYRFPAGSSVAFSAEGWSGTGGSDASYAWDFGDGTSSTGRNATHSYGRPGEYPVRLRVFDGESETNETRWVTIYPKAASAPAPPFPWSALLAVIGVTGAVAAAALFFGGTELGLFFLFSGLGALYTKLKKQEVLDNYLRGQIHGYIVANPGDHYTSIKEALGLKNGTAAHHLRVLESECLIASRTDGARKRFYPSTMRVPEPDGGALTEMERVLLERVAETPGITQKDVAGFLRVSRGTVNYHAEALIRKGRLRRERRGMSVRYFPLKLEPYKGEKEPRPEGGPSVVLDAGGK